MIAHDHQALQFAARNDAALCTIVGIDGSFSRRCGAQLAVGRDGTLAGDMADKCLDAELAAQASEAMSDGAPRLLRYGEGSPFIDFRLPCGSGLDILVDPAPDQGALAKCVADLENRSATSLALQLPGASTTGLMTDRKYIPALRIDLFGAGSECEALANLASAQGIAVERLEPDDGLSLGRAPQGIEADPWTAILLLFHDHEWEHALLDWALGTPAFYIGAQGGAPARETRIARLLQAGHSPEDVERVRGPVGLIPRARDSQVLALSILAEIVSAYEDLYPQA